MYMYDFFLLWRINFTSTLHPTKLELYGDYILLFSAIHNGAVSVRVTLPLLFKESP